MCKNLNFWYIFYHSAIWADHRMVKGKVFMSSQSFNFGTAMGNMMMKQLCWACTAGGAAMVKIVIFFFSKAAIFPFLKYTWLQCFTQAILDKSVFSYRDWASCCVWWLKTWKEEIAWSSVLPVADGGVGPKSPLPVTIVALASRK